MQFLEISGKLKKIGRNSRLRAGWFSAPRTAALQKNRAEQRRPKKPGAFSIQNSGLPKNPGLLFQNSDLVKNPGIICT